MKKFIVLLTKSPLPEKGRIGPGSWQDWFQGCKKAWQLSLKTGSPIIIASAFEFAGKKEADYYESVIAQLANSTGYAPAIISLYEGLHTITQLQAAINYAVSKKGEQLLVIWSFLHSFRWPVIKNQLQIPLPPGIKINHQVVFGLPRPKETLVDISLPIVLLVIKTFFPKYEPFFWRKFNEKVNARRQAGKI